MKLPIRKELPAGGRRPAVRRDGEGRRLISHIDLLRLRVSAAEKTWKEAKEQARQAKRRRKLAKLMARRAKKDAKSAKEKLDELRDALALAQASATTRRSRPATRKLSAGQPARTKSKKQPGAVRSTRKSSGTPRRRVAPLPSAPLPASAETIPGNTMASTIPESVPGEIPAAS